MIRRSDRIFISIFTFLAVLNYPSMGFGESDVDDQKLLIYEMNRGTKQVLVKTTADSTRVFYNVRGDVVYRITTNLRSGLLAIRSLKLGTPDPNHAPQSGFYLEPRRVILEVVDQQGQLITSKDLEIGSLCFDPTGQKIAFLSGAQIIEKDIKFHPERLGILDVQSGAVEWILGDSAGLPLKFTELGYRLNWTNDGKLYMTSWDGLLEIDLVNKKTVPTGLQPSSHLSPDGRFQLTNAQSPYLGSAIELFRVSDKTNLSQILYEILGIEILKPGLYISSVGWYGQEGSILYVDLRPLRRRGQDPTTKIKRREAYFIDINTSRILLHDVSGDLDFEAFSEVITNVPYVIIRNGNLQLLDSSAIELIQRNGSD